MSTDVEKSTETTGDTEPVERVEETLPDPTDRGLRRSGMFLIAGLAVEALSLAGLHTPAGFMAFAMLGGTLIGVGILSFLWTLVRRSDA